MDRNGCPIGSIAASVADGAWMGMEHTTRRCFRSWSPIDMTIDWYCRGQCHLLRRIRCHQHSCPLSTSLVQLVPPPALADDSPALDSPARGRIFKKIQTPGGPCSSQTCGLVGSCVGQPLAVSNVFPPSSACLTEQDSQNQEQFAPEFGNLKPRREHKKSFS